MASIVEYFNEDCLQLGLVAGEDRKRITVSDASGKTHRVHPDKVLFRHQAISIEDLATRLAALSKSIDVHLLWETLLAEPIAPPAQQADELARLYFDEAGPLHSSAMMRALREDRLLFRRRGLKFLARSRQELAELKQMREAEARAAEEIAELRHALERPELEPQLAERTERWLRGSIDAQLQTALANQSQDPARRAFELLRDRGYLPPTADIEILQTDLRAEHPPHVVDFAENAQPVPDETPVQPAAFSIDDYDTREVDDALSVTREGELVRIDVDIADVAAFVRRGDPVDREAARRAATAYLPTGTFYMLPPILSCERASLLVDGARPALRSSIWFDRRGEVRRHELQRCRVRVQQRLDYETADRLIQRGDGQDLTSEHLRLLFEVASAYRQLRRDRGALLVQRPEWKVRVTDNGAHIDITPLDTTSPARMLVGEMMVVTNALAAQVALKHQLPSIFRAQRPPVDELPHIDADDPLAMIKLRGLISPASMSVEPEPHWGLGLTAYTQISSPLRRYADLVQQRQLCAHLAGERVPHDTTSLREIVANLQDTDKQLRRVEAAVTQRWTLEYLARQPDQKRLAAIVIGGVTGGIKVRLLKSGATAWLPTPRKPARPGDQIYVDIDRVNPERGALRVLTAR